MKNFVLIDPSTSSEMRISSSEDECRASRKRCSKSNTGDVKSPGKLVVRVVGEVNNDSETQWIISALDTQTAVLFDVI
jgi:hypothetical protein